MHWCLSGTGSVIQCSSSSATVCKCSSSLESSHVAEINLAGDFAKPMEVSGNEVLLFSSSNC